MESIEGTIFKDQTSEEKPISPHCLIAYLKHWSITSPADYSRLLILDALLFKTLFKGVGESYIFKKQNTFLTI